MVDPRDNIVERIEPVFYRTEDFRDEEPLAWEIKNTGHEITLNPAA